MMIDGRDSDVPPQFDAPIVEEILGCNESELSLAVAETLPNVRPCGDADIDTICSSVVPDGIERLVANGAPLGLGRLVAPRIRVYKAKHLGGRRDVRALQTAEHHLPDQSNSPQVPDSGDGAGNDSNGGDGKGPKKPVESCDIVPTSPAVMAVVERLADHGYSVDAVPLTDSVDAQRRFRIKYLGLAKNELRAVQDSEATKNADSPLAWYGLSRYRGGRITIDNAVRILGYDDARQVLYRDGDFSESANIMELGPGNGDLIRGFYKAKARLSGYLDSAQMVKNHGRSRAIGRLNGQIEERTKGAIRTLDDDDLDVHLEAIDFIPAFATRLLQSNICAMTCDVTAKPEDLFSPKKLQTGRTVSLLPNAQDVIMMNLLLDRVEDIQRLIENIRLLAKMDRSTRFMVGAIFPFSSRSDSESPSTNIPSIQFWDERGDIRSRWALPDRAESIVNAVFDMNRLGLITERICELPRYEVYSPHNLIEKAGDLRTKYRHLVEKLEFQDPELQKLVQDVLDGTVPDDEMVAFPQSYDNKIVMLSGYVLPLDGSRYRMETAPIGDHGGSTHATTSGTDTGSSSKIKVA